MLKGGIVPKLISLLKTPSFRGKTLKLLYHLSVDDRCKSMVTYTDGRSIIYTLSLLSYNHYNHHHYHIIIIIIPPRNRYSYSDGSSDQFSTRLSC